MTFSIFWHIGMDPKKLRKMYMQTVPHLNKAIKHVQDQLSDLPPDDFLLETNVKPYASVKRKLIDRGERDPLKLSDLVRGRLFFSEQFNEDDVLNIVDKLFGEKIKKIDKNNNRSKEHGLDYHGITHVDFNLNGINFELQIMPIEFKPHKEFLHQIYDKFRDEKTREKLSDKQKAFLKKLHNKLYEQLDEQAKSTERS